MGDDPRSGQQSSPARAWALVILLMLAYVVSFVDRQVLNLLVEPIRSDLGISDTQMSFLQGFAFAVFYCIAGLPIGWIVDRVSRRNVIIAGITGWSFLTASCGLARNFLTLFLARVGVGIGEASLLPSAHSMISDIMPREKLGAAMSVFAMGAFFGGGAALAGGGAVIHLINVAELDTLPIIGPVKTWQMTFMLVSLPGFLLAPLFLLFREPRRTGLLQGSMIAPDRAGVPMRTVLAFFRENFVTFGCLFGGTAFLSLLLHGYAAWVPTFFIRTYGWTAPQIGLAYGAIFTFCGLAGVIVGGTLATVMMRRQIADAYMRVSLIAVLGITPMAVVAPLMGAPHLSLVFIALATFFGSMPLGTTGAAVQSITPNQIRGQATALSVFFINVISMGLGPTAIAVATDYVFGADEAVGYSLALVAGITGPVGALVFWFGLPHYRRSIERSRAWSEAG